MSTMTLTDILIFITGLIIGAWLYGLWKHRDFQRQLDLLEGDDAKSH